MGWRLGGKCASSRDPKRHFRNHEHGFHILGGFYHNSMKLLRDCYAEWKDPPNNLGFPDCALTPHNLVHLMRLKNNAWEHISVPFPERDGEFGDDEISLTPYEMTRAIWDWVKRSTNTPFEGVAESFHPQAHAHIDAVEKKLPKRDPIHLSDDHVESLGRHVSAFHAHVKKSAPLVPSPDSTAAKFDYAMMMEIALIIIRGILMDGVWRHGFDCINHREFSDWLRSHGASDAVINSPYIQGGYDYAFAYKGGDYKTRRFAAGAGLRGTLRMLLTYHGTVFAHMNGGMGEVIVTPLYEVLKARGVKFRFFNRVDRLELDAPGKSILKIHGTRQAKPKHGQDNYAPLIGYEDNAGEPRRFWPPHPKYEELSQPLKEEFDHAEDVYESPWWPGGEKFVLEHGKDFDIVVLAISAGALPYICEDLVTRHPRWNEMLANQKTVQTISAQFWLSQETKKLGWKGGPTALTAFAQPHATWADMTYLLKYERNNGIDRKELSYFCGTLPRLNVPQGVDYPALERDRVQKATNKWIAEHIRQLWPDAVLEADGSLKILIDRYVRANSLPAGGYVLSPPGTIDKRLRTNESGVSNLFLAGDWTRNGADTGSFENAVMSGLQCSRAICGHPRRIAGESDFA